MGGQPRRALVAIAFTALVAGCATPDGGLSPTRSAPEDPPASTTTTAVTTEDAAFPLPDITARRVTEADLLAMLPVASADGTTAVRPNAVLIGQSTFDADDEASDVARYVRITGVAGTYPEDDRTEHVWIDELDDAELARGYLRDAAGDIVKGSGGTHAPDTGAHAATEFPIEVGQEAIGLILTVEEAGTATETAVLFRVGRFVAFVSIERADDQDARVALQYLAEQVAIRIVDTLTTGDPSPPRPDHPPYRFETTVSIDDADDGRWILDSRGTVAAADRICTVRRTSPGGAIHREIIESDGSIYWRSPDDVSWAPAGRGNQTVTALLALCPAWPLDMRDAGLALSDEGTPHMVNGVASTGYRSDLAGLEAALGVELDRVSVDAFSFWIADDNPWLVELNVIVTGDADLLAPFIGSGFADLGEVTVTLRHRVIDLGTVDSTIQPPE